MTPEETREAAKVMMAFADGKVVQFRQRGAVEWQNIPDPHWDWVGNEYRVKPEPREYWVAEYFRDGAVVGAHATKEDAMRAHPHATNYYRVRQVTE